MNLFFKKLTGQLYSTEKMERRIMEEEERIARYRHIENSPELKEYLELKKTVESKEFQQKKHNWMTTKYKSTPTYATLKEYKSLLNDKNLQLFLELENSARLKEFLEFRQSENYVKLQSKKEVRNSLELKQMYAFEHSKEYKAYLTYRDSKLPARFKELVKKVTSDEFKKEFAFWSNPNRYKTTDEYQQEVRLKQLAAMADIVFYFKQDVNQIELEETWSPVFEDEFDWAKLSDSKWRAGFVYANPKLPKIHSYANEQQAYSGGKNVGTVDGKLHLFTKAERMTAPAWDTKKGFIEKDYEYTSDVIQTADHFQQKGGLFIAKVRVEGRMHHAIWLGKNQKLPLINLFHYNGKQIVIGNHTEKGFDGTTISGISPRQYYIYGLRWNENELIWYVNNVEVYRTKRNVPQEKLFLAIHSFIDEKQRAQEGQINVAWIRVLEKK